VPRGSHEPLFLVFPQPPGGIPIALPARRVCFSLSFPWPGSVSAPRALIRGETGFLIVAALLPVATSVITSGSRRWSWARCVPCARASTGASAGGAVGPSGPTSGRPGRKHDSGQWPLYFLKAVPWFVVRSCSTWCRSLPIPTRSPTRTSCATPRIDTASAQEQGTGSVRLSKVLDPLCPACKAFSSA